MKQQSIFRSPHESAQINGGTPLIIKIKEALRQIIHTGTGVDVHPTQAGMQVVIHNPPGNPLNIMVGYDKTGKNLIVVETLEGRTVEVIKADGNGMKIPLHPNMPNREYESQFGFKPQIDYSQYTLIGGGGPGADIANADIALGRNLPDGSQQGFFLKPFNHPYQFPRLEVQVDSDNLEGLLLATDKLSIEGKVQQCQIIINSLHSIAALLYEEAQNVTRLNGDVDKYYWSTRDLPTGIMWRFTGRTKFPIPVGTHFHANTHKDAKEAGLITPIMVVPDGEIMYRNGRRHLEDVSNEVTWVDGMFVTHQHYWETGTDKIVEDVRAFTKKLHNHDITTLQSFTNRFEDMLKATGKCKITGYSDYRQYML